MLVALPLFWGFAYRDYYHRRQVQDKCTTHSGLYLSFSSIDCSLGFSQCFKYELRRARYCLSGVRKTSTMGGGNNTPASKGANKVAGLNVYIKVAIIRRSTDALTYEDTEGFVKTITDLHLAASTATVRPIIRCHCRGSDGQASLIFFLFLVPCSIILFLPFLTCLSICTIYVDASRQTQAKR
jgi:hypothetical protein